MSLDKQSVCVCVCVSSCTWPGFEVLLEKLRPLFALHKCENKHVLVCLTRETNKECESDKGEEFNSSQISLLILHRKVWRPDLSVLHLAKRIDISSWHVLELQGFSAVKRWRNATRNVMHSITNVSNHLPLKVFLNYDYMLQYWVFYSCGWLYKVLALLKQVPQLRLKRIMRRKAL